MELVIAGIGAIIVGAITLAQLATRNWNPMTWVAKRPRFWRVVVVSVLEQTPENQRASPRRNGLRLLAAVGLLALGATLIVTAAR